MILNITEISNKLLIQAENLFGLKVEDWVYNHDVIFQEGPPHIIYHPSRFISISLSKSAQDSEYKVVAQLSHEIAHVVSPARNPNKGSFRVLVINEGVSEYFSLLVLVNWFGYDIKDVYESKSSPYPEYFEALNLIIDLHKDNEAIIKRLRKRQQYLNELTFEDIRAENKTIDDVKIQKLLTKFA
jgi:hypothetical protein